MLEEYPFLKEKFLKLSAAKHSYFKYEALFIDSFNNKLPCVNVVSLKIESDYVNEYSSYKYLTVQVLKSVYLKLLNCDPNNLQLSLKRTNNSTLGFSINDVEKSENTVYQAFICNRTNEKVGNKEGGLTGGHLDDLSELKTLEIQLVERSLQEFKLMETYSTYKNNSIEDIITGLMSTKISTLKNKHGCYGCTVIPSDNPKRRYQVVVPSPTKLVNLPKYMQDTYGVYGTGIGYFLEGEHWYIYPSHDYTRFDKGENRTMTIVALPKNDLPGSDKTHLNDNGNIFVFATGSVIHADNFDRDIQKGGSGFRASKAGNLVDNSTLVKDGKLIIPPGRNNVIVNFDKRETTNTNISSCEQTINDNPLSEASKITTKLGNDMLFSWNSSDHYLIYSGMPVKVIYASDGKLKSLQGVLTRADTLIRTDKISPIDNRYVSNTVLTVHCEPV